ncbi:MAG: excinuclease ABC subunit UvrC [Nitrospiraceae bacterium]|nr:MAG: excinuclease ABC subunit UvrC [Nitrospiraceae bacterium]
MDKKQKLSQVPTSPGIYIMRGQRERVIYVGKAKNLRNRLRSYFQKSAALDDRKTRMVQDIVDFDYIVTKNELEALILEANFIKKTKPRYNIILRDDKHYPYLKLTVNEEWPRLEVVRRIERDGALYFGPYVPAGAMRDMLDFIHWNFPIRTCRYKMDRPFRPCVQYQMGRCPAPCAKDRRSPEDKKKYMEVVEEVKSFIKGEKKELVANLQDRMQKLSDNLLYEDAAKIRDRMTAIKKSLESQRAIAAELNDVDVISLYREKQEAVVYMFFIRNGTVIGQKDFFLKHLGEMDNRELIAGFLEQFYFKEILIPPRIILPLKARLTTEKRWLTEKRGSTVNISHAKTDTERKVLKMTDDNALYSYNKHKEQKVDETILKVKDLLHLNTVPARIGSIDVSNISGSESVGALIIYENGRFLKDGYRQFKIRTVKRIDDFAMIGEVAGRYLKGLSEDGGDIPDLLLIDGGKGQLSHVVEALKPFDIQFEIAAIAKAKHDTSGKVQLRVQKDLDRIYLPGKRAPIYLEPALDTTHLLQRIRNEAHRFAITCHRKLRAKKTFQSPLEQMKGIGKARRFELLKHFSSIEAMRNAPVDEIVAVKGMNRKLAEELKIHLKNLKKSGAVRND